MRLCNGSKGQAFASDWFQLVPKDIANTAEFLRIVTGLCHCLGNDLPASAAMHVNDAVPPAGAEDAERTAEQLGARGLHCQLQAGDR